jgi:hypothetical protein
VKGRDEYRVKALECVREAERLRDAGERQKLLHIAELYMALARRVADWRESRTTQRRSEHYPEDA